MVVLVHANSGGGGGGGGASAPDVTPYRGTATTVPPNALTTVVSRVVPGGFAFKVHGILVSGNAPAEWALFDNGTEVLRSRTSPTDRGKDLLEGRANALSFAAGRTVELKVEHTETDRVSGSTSRNFQATILGRDA